ncbi:hypothetical protein B0T18DRAFT_396779 [Schizothecium vesticola]|uniref:Secreted protein n=1 Tax=Schizothecium vesticola TaxID=314040 RepID=A0AA40F982_9PEZI|nr:hypothetical protein B0T18DRAFT_396779 [Schizothecium vesticola]
MDFNNCPTSPRLVGFLALTTAAAAASTKEPSRAHRAGTSTSPDSNQQMPPTTNPTLFQPRVLRRRFRAGKEGWLRRRRGGWQVLFSWHGGGRGPSAKLARDPSVPSPGALWGRRWRGWW